MARQYLEDEAQQMLFVWLARQHPTLTAFAIPNGGKRNMREAVRLKRQGVKAGVADVFIARASGRCHGLFLELKAPKGSASAEQLDFGISVAREGYAFRVARGFDEAREAVEAYLKSPE